ncbi:MAG: hypothetical protein ACE5OZ_19955 [Candidatus Heimdallarchaeota archaeon]
MRERNQYILYLLIGIVVLIPISRSSAAIVWSEEFENLDDWELFGYKFAGIPPNHLHVASTPNLIIDDGVLTRNSSAQGLQIAYRNSSVAYGTWSFDWIVDPGSEGTLIVNFIQNNHYPSSLNVSGVEYKKLNYTGYALYLEHKQGRFEFSFSKWENTDNQTIGHQLQTQIQTREDGIHHIRIGRESNGKFTFVRNSSVIMTEIDNSFTTSEYFNLVLWGKAKIDNILVETGLHLDNSSATRDANFPILFTFFSVGLLISMRRKREK